MTSFFTSAFYFPGLTWPNLLIAIALGIVFGAIWLSLYRPPLFKDNRLLLVAVVSAFLTWTGIAFVQIPLQTGAGKILSHFWDQITLIKWLLLAGIPQILLSGIVQEATKLLPVFGYWWRNHRELTPKQGLVAGAVAGAGFGVFEAIWVHNSIFAAGWTWSTVETGGFLSLLGFWERFFSVAFHTGVSALAGYGLANRQLWKFYLLAAFLHGLTNYSVLLLQKNVLTAVQVEIYIAILAAATITLSLSLYRRKAAGIQTQIVPPVSNQD